MIFLQATTTAATATPLSVILSAMLMPLIFLLVFSTIKNFVAVGIDKIDLYGGWKDVEESMTWIMGEEQN